MQSMNKQRTDPGVVRDGQCTFYRILKQCRAKLLSLGAAIYCQPAKDKDGQRVRHIAPYLASGLAMRQGASGQRVIRKDMVRFIADHKCPAGTACLVG